MQADGIVGEWLEESSLPRERPPEKPRAAMRSRGPRGPANSCSGAAGDEAQCGSRLLSSRMLNFLETWMAG